MGDFLSEEEEEERTKKRPAFHPRGQETASLAFGFAVSLTRMK